MRLRCIRNICALVLLSAVVGYTIYMVHLNAIEEAGISVWTYRELNDTLYPDSTQKYRKHHSITHEPVPDSAKGKRLVFHEVYEPRQIGLVNYTGVPPNGKPKIILLWTPWNHQWRTVNYYFLREGKASFTKFGCPNTNCIVTTKRWQIKEADAILFHLLDINKRDFPRYRDPLQRWILYIMEAPWLLDVELEPLNGKFNWTMSYREDSDVPVRYGFVGSRVTPSAYDLVPKIEDKSKWIVWFVSDCKTEGHREEYVKELSKHIPVDIYGTCGTLKCFPSQSDECYKKVLKQYKFYLSFENSICKDYVTEKFFNILDYDIVPIVFGGSPYSKIAVPGSFIDTAEFPDPRHLASYLRSVGMSQKLYSTFFEWKKTQKVYLDPWMCRLCDKLNEKDYQESVHKNLKKWWVSEAQCKQWKSPDKGFVSVP